MEISPGPTLPPALPPLLPVAAPVDPDAQLPGAAARAIEALIVAVRALPGERPGGGAYEFELQLGAERLSVTSDRPLPEGTRILLSSPGPDRLRVESVLSDAGAAPALKTALREALPAQLPVPDALRRIAALAANPALPAPLRERIAQMLADLPDNAQLQTAQGLRQAVRNSGIFLESRLFQLAAAGIPASAATPDSAPDALLQPGPVRQSPPGAQPLPPAAPGGANPIASAREPAGPAAQPALPGNPDARSRPAAAMTSLRSLLAILLPPRAGGAAAAAASVLAAPAAPAAAPGATYDARGLLTGARFAMPPVAEPAATVTLQRQRAPSGTGTSLPAATPPPAAATPPPGAIPMAPATAAPSAEPTASGRGTEAAMTTPAPPTEPRAGASPGPTGREAESPPASGPAPIRAAAPLATPASAATIIEPAQPGAPRAATGAAVVQAAASATPLPLAPVAVPLSPVAVAVAQTPVAVTPAPRQPAGALPVGEPRAITAPAETVGGRWSQNIAQPPPSPERPGTATPAAATVPATARMPPGPPEPAPASTPAGNAPGPAAHTSAAAVASATARPTATATATATASVHGSAATSPAGAADAALPQTSAPDPGSTPPAPGRLGTVAQTKRPAGTAAMDTGRGIAAGLPAQRLAQAAVAAAAPQPARTVPAGSPGAASARGAVTGLQLDLKAQLSGLVEMLAARQTLAASAPGAASLARPGNAGAAAGGTVLYTARGIVAEQENIADMRLAPVADEAAARGLHAPEIAAVNRAAESGDMVEQLMRYVMGALARTRVHQLGSHAEGRRQADSTVVQAWSVEIPIAHGSQLDALELQVEDRGARQGPGGTPERVWQLMMSISIEQIGPVHALLQLSGSRLATTLWVERESTLASARQAMHALAELLRAEGVEVTRLDCLPGSPPPERSRLCERLLEVQT